MPKGSSHRVVMIVGDGSNPFEMGVATELFGLRRPELRRPWYDFALAAPGGQARMHLGFFTLADVSGLEAVDAADTVIVPNRPDPHLPADPEILAAIQRADARGARLMSFCTGAFTLADAGVLDDRRATTHWRWAEEFTARYPRVQLEPDVLFVEDGTVFTAAGSAAALDLSLHVIQRDHGAEIANAVSRRLVFTGHREGGQRQFVERPVPEIPDASLAPVLEWARQHLDQPLAVADLAARVGQRRHPAPPVPRRTRHDAAGLAHRRTRDAGPPPHRTRRAWPGPHRRPRRAGDQRESAAAAAQAHRIVAVGVPETLRAGRLNRSTVHSGPTKGLLHSAYSAKFGLNLDDRNPPKVLCQTNESWPERTEFRRALTGSRTDPLAWPQTGRTKRGDYAWPDAAWRDGTPGAGLSPPSPEARSRCCRR